LEKSRRNSHHSSSHPVPDRGFSRAAAFAAAAVFVPILALATKSDKPKSEKAKPSPSASRLETHVDLIQKAQNLTLQRDRLQASQLLTRALQKESRGSVAHRELAKALDELTSVFYSERAQGLFAAGESAAETRPRDALAHYQEALRVEDGNVTVLKALARTHLVMSDCDRADAATRSAEAINEFSAEVKLLRLQVLACQRNFDSLRLRLADFTADLEPVEAFTRGIQMRSLHQDKLAENDEKELKKAKSLLAAWESASPDYPELHFWKWEHSRLVGTPDRASALRYSRLCQNLTPRKRKSYSADVELCKGKDAVDKFLKESASPTPTAGEREQ
jgi:hypothetical protein